jgi:predicted PP-loop superfamily ATPase
MRVSSPLLLRTASKEQFERSEADDAAVGAAARLGLDVSGTALSASNIYILYNH